MIIYTINYFQKITKSIDSNQNKNLGDLILVPGFKKSKPKLPGSGTAITPNNIYGLGSVKENPAYKTFRRIFLPLNTQCTWFKLNGTVRMLTLLHDSFKHEGNLHIN